MLGVDPVLTRSQDGPNDLIQFQTEMGTRQIAVHETEPDVFSYEFRGVQAEAINCPTDEARREHLIRRIRTFQPDWVLVADDKRKFLLASALAAAPGRVIPLLQTIMQLPFGPLSVDENEPQTQLMREAAAIIVISEYLKDYIYEHSGMNSHVLPMPVYGAGPFRDLARSDAGFVTMINPCELKGVAIFLGLARTSTVRIRRCTNVGC